MITIRLKNPPYGAYYWVGALYSAGQIRSSDYLRLDNVWHPSWYGLVDFRAIVYTSDKSILDDRDLYGITIEDEHEYAYNWATGSWEDLTTPIWELNQTVTGLVISPIRKEEIIMWKLQQSITNLTVNSTRKEEIVWALQQTVTGLSVNPKMIPIPPIPPVPPIPEPEEFNWMPWAIGGGVALLIITTKRR